MFFLDSGARVKIDSTMSTLVRAGNTLSSLCCFLALSRATRKDCMDQVDVEAAPVEHQGSSGILRPPILDPPTAATLRFDGSQHSVLCS